jgi:hypothetical protein
VILTTIRSWLPARQIIDRGGVSPPIRAERLVVTSDAFTRGKNRG